MTGVGGLNRKALILIEAVHRRPLYQKTVLFLIAIMIAGTVTVNFTFEKTKTSTAIPIHQAKLTIGIRGIQPFVLQANLTLYALGAFLAGWNSSSDGANCSPVGTAVCNPRLVMFRGATTTVKLTGESLTSHTFSLYTAGTPAISVSQADPCSPTNTNGCLFTTFVGVRITKSITWTPSIPLDDFTGLGVYEYYCQIHPDSMHGKITVYKNPDVDKNRVVDIVDASALAISFDTTHGMTGFNAAVDLNNDGRIDILDASILANLFDQRI